MSKYLKVRSAKKNFLNLVLITILFILTFSTYANAKIVSTEELVENTHQFDGKIVTFRGEIIGDIMVRKNHAWIHINDDPYAENPSKLAGYNSGMAIWCKTEDAKLIKYMGNYKNRGDFVEVTGVFHAACFEHDGDMDIHATRLKIIETGYPIKHEFQTVKFWWAIILGIIASALFLVNKFWCHR